MQVGNPINSQLVRDYKDGYGVVLDGLGYAPRSAKHCPWDKLESLISQVEMEQLAASQKVGAALLVCCIL